MAEYEFIPGVIELSVATDVSRATTGFEVEVDDDRRVGVVITRQPRGAETLEELAEGITNVSATAHAGSQPSPPRSFLLKGARAVAVDVISVGDSGPMLQKLALVEVDPVVFSLAVVGDEDLRPHVERVFEMVCARVVITPAPRPQLSP